MKQETGGYFCDIQDFKVLPMELEPYTIPNVYVKTWSTVIVLVVS